MEFIQNTTKNPRTSKFQPNLLDQFCRGLEFWVRFYLDFASVVNVPAYLQIYLPELDKVCSVIQAYFLLQVVGLCWALLVNSALAVAVQWAKYLPLSSGVDGASTIRLVAAFYVSYATFRVIISFAQCVSHFALESIKDFPEASKLLSSAGVLTLHLSPIVLVPAILAELGLLIADSVCLPEMVGGDAGLLNSLCRGSGLVFLTSAHPQFQRLAFFSLTVMIVQLWQVLLNQFPRWDLVFRRMDRSMAMVLHTAAALLAVLTVLGLFVTSLDILLRKETVSHLLLWRIMNLALFGWTLWLCAFMPTLLSVQGKEWAERVSMAALQQLAAQLRISLICLLGIAFVALAYSTSGGVLTAQLDLVLATITVPVLFVAVYLLTAGAIQMGLSFLLWGVPISGASAWLILWLSGLGSSAGGAGRGSVLLVTLHLLSKLSQIWGSSPGTLGSDSEGWWRWGSENDLAAADVATSETRSEDPTYSRSNSMNFSSQLSLSRHGSSALLVAPSVNVATINIPTDSLHEKSWKESARHRSNSGNSILRTVEGLDTAASTPTIRTPTTLSSKLNHMHTQLSERGSRNSPLVSLGLAKSSIAEHWYIVAVRRYLFFLSNIVRQLLGLQPYSSVAVPIPITTATDSTDTDELLKARVGPRPEQDLIRHVPSLSGLMRIGTMLAIASAAVLGAISVASVLQQDAGFFPDLIDFRWDSESGAMLFDHRVSNVTLYSNLNNASCGGSPPLRIPPHYAICSWEWKGTSAKPDILGLSLLDMSLLAEMSYLSDPLEIESSLSLLFPDLVFSLVHAPASDDGHSSGPMYLEVHSERLGGSVMAIRGTDVGRLRDLLEDAKLYAETVIFSLLGTVFFPMQLWTDSTAGAVVQLLHEASQFLGPLGAMGGVGKDSSKNGSDSAEYYQPLVLRVLELVALGKEVVVTGHSLGGGLAGVVGALAGVPSVSLSGPGLGLSHRKFKVQLPDGSWKRISGKSALHHQSFTLLTEFDWIPLVDRQVGLVQQIQCEQPAQAHLNACHMLEGTICHLLRHCGDRKGRFNDCTFSYDLGSVIFFPVLRNWAWEKRLLILPLLLLGPLVIALAVLPDLL